MWSLGSYPGQPIILHVLWRRKLQLEMGPAWRTWFGTFCLPSWDSVKRGTPECRRWENPQDNEGQPQACGWRAEPHNQPLCAWSLWLQTLEEYCLPGFLPVADGAPSPPSASGLTPSPRALIFIWVSFILSFTWQIFTGLFARPCPRCWGLSEGPNHQKWFWVWVLAFFFLHPYLHLTPF